MHRTAILLVLAATLTLSLAASVLQAQDAAPAGQVPACRAAQSPQAGPMGSAAPALGTGISPVAATTCTPSPLCPGSSACDADCKSRGARFGFCTAEKCCACIWKI